MKNKTLPLFLSLLCLNVAAEDMGSVKTPPPLTTIPSLDVARYMGTWFEIARYPNRFQKKCTGFVQADYSIRSDGNVRVLNSCRLANGELTKAEGVGKQVSESDSPKLKVRFAPAWLSFIPAVWGDYWVIDLDEAYQLVAVSEPRREYLWVLSRTPTVDSKAYEALLQRLAQEGFDLKRLELTQQE